MQKRSKNKNRIEMLRLFNVKTELSAFSNIKCAEIFFQTVDSFSFVCTFCEIKNFEFSDFLLHFKNVHFDRIDSIRTPLKDEGEVPTIEVPPNEFNKVSSEQSKNNILDVSLEMRDIGTATHTAIEHKSLATKSWTNAESSTEKSFDDSVSDESEDTKDDQHTPTVFKRTPISVARTKYECSECTKSYKLPKSLECHKSKCHNTENVEMLKCLHCDIEFTNERARSKHIRTDHDEFRCDQCNKTYKSKRGLNYHNSKHTGELNFVCDIENCGKAFFHKKRLSAHKNYAHSLERKYVCEMCGFGLKSKQALEIHKRSHTGEKPFACEECERRFASTSQLIEHKAMHSTERPHVCHVCGAAFARQKALYHHKHLHLDIKKFVCKICGKAYAQAAGLCGHMRQHKAKQF